MNETLVTAARAWSAKRPGGADSTLAGVLLVIGLVAVHHVEAPADAWDAWIARDALVGLLFVPLAWRRRAPRVVVFVVSIAAAASWIAHFVDGTTAVAGGIAVYGVGRYVGRPTSLRTITVATAFLGAVPAAEAIAGSDSWYIFFARCTVIGACFAFGDSQRSRAALVASLRADAERAESLRRLEAERAVADERARIAREMHDIIAHSLSVMVVQAVAAEHLVAAEPAAASTSMASVAEVGRRALGDMRRIFDIFDAPDGTDAFVPQPSLAELDTIVDRYRSAGMTVELDRCGELPDLDSATQLAIVRIVQESLTNVLRHAPGADASVTLTFGDEFTVEIADTGRGSRPEAPNVGAGRGLIGMRERVDALGGTMTARRDAGRGFVVRAVLPATPDSTRALSTAAGPT